MATLPIANTVDKRIGLIAAVTLLLITFIVLLFLTYDIPNPLPVDKKVIAKAEITQIELKKLVVEGAGASGGGTPSSNPIDEPKPQTQNAITSTTKPRPTTTQTGGNANNTNAQNSNNTSSSTQASSNPFGDGGSGGGSGGGNGTGFGSDEGEGSSTSTGIGFGKGRTRSNNVNVNGISIETDATIYYKLTVDSEGNVVAFSHNKSLTTTTDQTLINRIGFAIIKQVKYSAAKGSPLVYQDYSVSVKAT